MKFLVFCLISLCMVFAFVATAKAADDPLKVAPDHYKILLENDEVRVLEFKAKAGDKIPSHYHPNHTAYVVQGGKGKFDSAGKITELDMQTGQALYIPAGDHAVEVVGPGDVHVVIVELKK